MSPRINRSQLDVYSYFHICARGNNGENIFRQEKDYCKYLSVVERSFRSNTIRCFAFCLMTNHVHFLLQVPGLSRLSGAIHSAHTSYAIYFNACYARSGHLFSDRFRSWVIKDANHFLSAKEYIEQNPVYAGLVKNKKQYRWSSGGRGTELSITSLLPIGY